jgi:GntR family transcriptional regulator
LSRSQESAPWTGDTRRIRRSSPVPLHLQFRQHVIDLIEEGRLRSGAQLPPERDLAARYGLSLAPVRQAILDLAREGIVQRVRGRGTFVRGRAVEEQVSVLTSFSESMRQKGRRVRMHMVRNETTVAAQEAAEALQLPGREAVIIERVGMLDEEPVAVLTAFLSPQRFPGITGQALTGGSLYRTLEERFGVIPVRAYSSLSVARANTRNADLLDVPAGSPLLMVTGTAYDEGDMPVEWYRVWYLAERFKLSFESRRSSKGVTHRTTS